jgi:calpain-15
LNKGKKLQIFDASIEPSDIAQGGLGDCYFLSTLSVLAEKPNRIRKMFIDGEANEYGIYGVWASKNGMRH